MTDADDGSPEDDPIRPALAIPLVLVALALPACGDDEPDAAAGATQTTTDTQERRRATDRRADDIHLTRDALFARLSASDLRLQRVRGTDVPQRTITPPPDERTRYAEKSGSTFDVLWFLTPADARVAAPSVEAAPSVDRIAVAGNVVVAYPEGVPAEVRAEVERVLTR